MKKKKLTYHDREVRVAVESYRNNGTLALMLHYKDDGDTEVITTNLNDFMQSDSLAYLDSNNYEDIEDFIVRNKLGTPLGISTRSGFWEYPLYNINRDAL